MSQTNINFNGANIGSVNIGKPNRPKEKQTRTIPISLAKKIVNNCSINSEYKVKVLDTVLQHSSRWTNTYDCIFINTNYPDQYWSIEYVEGKTEDVWVDEEDIFPNMENGEVQCQEVYPTQKVITVYK